MSNTNPACAHRIYLLSVWQNEDQRWHFLIQDPRTGTRQGFTGTEALGDAIITFVSNEPAGNELAGDDATSRN